MPSRLPTAALSVALAAVLMAPVCLGAGIRWSNSHEEALKVAKETGRPLVAVVVQKGKVNDLKRIFATPKLVRYGRVFIFCYEEVEIVNNTIRSQLLGKYRFQGQLRLPYFYFADTAGKVLGQTQDASPDTLNTMMLLAYKRHGPVADPKMLKAAMVKLKEADALYEKGQTGAAATLYQEIVDMKFKAPPVEAANGKLAQIEQTIKQQLDDARADLKEKAYAKAVPALLELAREYGSLEAGKEARKELAELRSVPEAKDAFELAARRAREAPEDPTTPAAVTEAEWKIDGFTDAELDALDAMAPGGGDAPAAPKATADDAIARKCRRLLGLARNWIANKQPDKARRLLQQVVDEHGDTLYAEQAKAILAGLK